MIPRDWLRTATDRLTAIADADAAADALLLLTHATGLPRHKIRLEQADLPDGILKRLENTLSRRLTGEPVQYILGEAWFLGRAFYVDGRCLIPRFDTEILVEEALRLLKGAESPRVLDLCCGSGCIGLSIKAERPDASVTLADVDRGALEVSRINGEKLGVSAEYAQTDLFSCLSGRTFDLICCNPPYIPDGDADQLDEIVRREPALALFGGADGLDFYRRLRQEAPEHLKPGGHLVMEIGIHQAEDIRRLFGDIPILPDLAGIPRTAVWHKE